MRRLFASISLSTLLTVPVLHGHAIPTSPTEDPSLVRGRKKVAAPPVLEVQTVVTSSLLYHPLIQAAQTELPAAAAELLAAEGAFDPTIKGGSSGYALGDYSGTYWDAGIDVPIQAFGGRFFSGYRRSGGTFPIYENEFETNRNGEARVGIEVPLFRDGAIDRRRATISRQEIQQLVAANNIEQRRIEMARAGQIFYWDWVAARLRRETYARLLTVAKERDKQLKERVEKGDLPQFDRVDNQRALLQREAQLIAADQQVRRAEFELSLLFRGSSGEPLPVSQYAHPQDFPNPPAIEQSLDETTQIAEAIATRPELKRLEAQRDQNSVEQDLNRNQFLPRVDVQGIGARDYGAGSTSRDEEELKLGVKFEIPLRLRQQEGRKAALAAKQRELSLLHQFAEQRITTDVKDALTALRLARQRYGVAQQEVKAARELEKGERTRFELGDSNLIFVNLREQTTADAEIRLIDTSQDFWRAHANLLAAKGKIPYQIDSVPTP